MDVETLTVHGGLSWDTSRDGLELRAGYILVTGHGCLEVGTRLKPMERRATIYLKKGAHHATWGTRFLWGEGNSQIEIHGRTLRRTWTLLARTAAFGNSTLELEDDVESHGWRVGDTIGIATTNRGSSRPYKITALRHAGVIEIDPPLANEHLGGLYHVKLQGATGSTFDRHLGLAAEVVNLERSVLITGEPNWDTPTREGLHTGMHSTGHMDVRYTRVENCGQPPNLGKYCLHFHRMHRCPKCVFQGNAVVNGTQNGITIHGTHQSLVDQNTLWNTASVGIYMEDGNEMNNTVSENAIICMHPVPIDAINAMKPAENCQRDLHNEPGRLGGIFAIGMTNDFIRNRIVNMENGIWFKGSADPNGRGAAAGRICTKHAPFGKISGNVCHDNRRFGIYLDFQQPRNIKRDEDGMLPKKADGSTDWSSCDELTADGQDNGVQPANRVVDELDYHNLFVGQYISSDVEYRGYIGINNAHCMYWKSSKNFADGTAYHIRDSMCITDWSDPVFKTRPEVGPSGHILGPAGAFTFRLKNVTFAGDGGGMGALSAGQHCGLGDAGGPCDVQYLLEQVDFSGLRAGSRHLNFGANSKPEGEVLPVFLAHDNSLGGFRAVVSSHLDGFEKEGCVPLGWEFDHGLGCSFSVRRFNLWTKKDLGKVRILGPGYGDSPNQDSPTLCQNAGYLLYTAGYNGYGALVIPGKTYELRTNFTHGIRVDFSEWLLPQLFGKQEESIVLRTALGNCTVLSEGAGRGHYGRLGPDDSASQGSCRTTLGGDLPMPTPGPLCQTAVPGDECYPHVEWAMQFGIAQHPDRYPGMTVESSFEDFQAFLHQTSHHDVCRMPCTACHTALPGEECYGHVTWAMDHGIQLNPEVYQGLTTASSFEEFQSFLHGNGHGNCLMPCPPAVCHTAVEEDECYGHVMWAKDTGIVLHPENYQGLTRSSLFEDFQAFLFSTGHGNCPEPCPVPAAGRTAQRTSQRTAQRSVQPGVGCHSVVVGEVCFAHVASAAATSIRHTPKQYVGKTASQLFAEIQAELHRKGFTDCPMPCEAESAVGAMELFRPLSLGLAWPALVAWGMGLSLSAALVLPLVLGAARRWRARPQRGFRVLPGELPRA